MLDMYAEFIVKKRPDAKTSLVKMLIVFATAVLIYAVIVICQSYNIITFMPVCVTAVGWAGYRAYLMFNYEFEYIVTNGELDIDRIIARRGRKRVINIKTDAYELISPYDEEHRASYDEGTFAKTIDARSHPGAAAWFVIANVRNIGRVRLLFEPTPKMLRIFSDYVPRRMAVKYEAPVED